MNLFSILPYYHQMSEVTSLYDIDIELTKQLQSSGYFNAKEYKWLYIT
ncbi:hypothetical protein [Peribacillus simplex]|nr:hypothetical protein [Peribacillus simplex]WHY99609.1 hypothetical protein QNH37_10895 [Peribacillus simplex]